MTACRPHAVPSRPQPTRGRALRRVAIAAALIGTIGAPVRANPPAGLDATLLRAVEAEVRQAAEAQPGLPVGSRVVVELGRLDPRLRLAPCAQVEHRLAGRAWGSARVALRCVNGATRWQVHLPVTVQVHGPGWVAAGDLPAGTVLGPEHLMRGEVDLASGALSAEGPSAAGRTLARPVDRGQPLRSGDLRARQWFAAGDTVHLDAVGRGYRVTGQGQALAAGIEGQRVRVRTDGGRIVTGLPVGDGRVEVAL
jgi:flagella basal body P-ring formation protein FlgA